MFKRKNAELKAKNKRLKERLDIANMTINLLEKQSLATRQSLLQVLKDADKKLNSNSYNNEKVVIRTTSDFLKNEIDILEKDIKIELSATTTNQNR